MMCRNRPNTFARKSLNEDGQRRAHRSVGGHCVRAPFANYGPSSSQLSLQHGGYCTKQKHSSHVVDGYPVCCFVSSQREWGMLCFRKDI